MFFRIESYRFIIPIKDRFIVDFYLIVETVVPLIVAIAAYRFALFALKSKPEFRAVFKILLSLSMLVAMVAAFLFTARYFNKIRCEAAYGPLAAAPEMCDGPADGMFALFVQMPVILVFWLFLSVLIAIKAANPKSA